MAKHVSAKMNLPRRVMPILLPRLCRSLAMALTVVLLGVELSGIDNQIVEAARPPVPRPETARSEAAAAQKPVREIFVPFEDLNVILESDVRRVYMDRKQYEAMLAKVRTSPRDPAPIKTLLLSADYRGKLEPGRARIAGKFQIDVLEDGLQQLPLRFNGVGIRSAKLDGKAASLARRRDGQVVLFVNGEGTHTLEVELLAPLAANAAEQSLNLLVPTPANTRMQFVVPGDVEVKGGATVASRQVIDGDTHLDIIPPRGSLSLAMSLNNVAAQTRQVVVARGVIVDEVTKVYERLHARISMNVLYGKASEFRFELPPGFEVNKVNSPLMAQWAVAKEMEQEVLTVTLRTPTAGPVPLNIALVNSNFQLSEWKLPQLRPLDVAGQVAVVGLVAEQRLNAEQIAASGLIPVNNQVLTSSIPASVFETEAGAPPIRPIATYFAPQAEYDVQATFVEPAAQHRVDTHLGLSVSERELALRARFSVVPLAEKLFELKIDLPAAWHVSRVVSARGKALPYEQMTAQTDEGESEESSVLRIRFPAGAPMGMSTEFRVHAVSVPENWLSDWQQNEITFPRVVVSDASHDSGAISIVALDDFRIRSENVEGVRPLNGQERIRYGISNAPSLLAYSYDRQPFELDLAVQRREPWVTARTHSFLTVLPDSLKAHYEVEFLVQQAGVRQLAFDLPEDTPEAISIRGLDGVRLKETSSEVVDGRRRWTVLLGERRRGRVRLAVDFLNRLPSQEPKGLPLPLIEAVDVAFQSGHVAVEGSPELDVQVATAARSVDVGELSAADYLPGPRLLGAFAYGGGKTDVKIDVFRHASYALPSAIVERAEMATAIGADGVSQSVVRYRLRTKASFLEVELPAGSSLWSAYLVDVADSTIQKPLKPQRDGARLLVSLPGEAIDVSRDLRIIFETPSQPLGLFGSVDLLAPKLFLKAAEDAESAEVPVADIRWNLQLPAGYRITDSDGTVFSSRYGERTSPLAKVAQSLYVLAGQARPGFSLGLFQIARNEMAKSAYVSSESARMKKGDWMEEVGGYDEGAAAPSRDSAVPKVTVPLTQSEPSFEINEPVEEREEALFDMEDADDAFGDEADEKEDSVDSAAAPADHIPMPPTPSEAEDPFAAPPIVKNGSQRGLEEDKLDRNRLGKFGKRSYGYSSSQSWALEGISSLNIKLTEQNDKDPAFLSLGVAPRLQLTLVENNRLRMLVAATGMLVLLMGVVLTRRSAKTKIRFIIAVALLSSLIPLVFDGANSLAETFDIAFFAVCLLIPYYLVAGLIRWMFGRVAAAFGRHRHRPITATVVSALVMLALVSAAVPQAAQSAPPVRKQLPVVVQVESPPEPVKVPRDAVIIPYNVGKSVELSSRVGEADKVLVPYDEYVRLWNLANPDKRIGSSERSTLFALSGGTFTARLEGDEFLIVRGHLDVELFVDDDVVSVPLALRGAVLTEAKLDGEQAKLQFMAPSNEAGNRWHQPGNRRKVQQQVAQPPVGQPLVILLASGKGRHRLEIAARVPLERRSGWRSLAASIPSAPATALALTVPVAKTEVRLPAAKDRQLYETTSDGEVIETVLGPAGLLNIQWRPRVSEAALDRSLTAESQALFDVREDGRLLMWNLHVDFGGSEREAFSISVPQGYLIERITGSNVRGWKARTEDDGQHVDVTLLKASTGKQAVVVRAARYETIDSQAAAELRVPSVMVDGAALHRGVLVVRRSPILRIQTTEQAGVTRLDASAIASGRLAKAMGAEESPLGIEAHQAFRFISTPFRLGLSIRQVEAEQTAAVQTILRVAPRETILDSRIQYDVKNRRLHRLKIALPEGFELNDSVRAPEPFEWTVSEEAGQRVLNIQLGSGQLGSFPVFVGGRMTTGTDRETLSLPRLSVLDVEQQESDVVVQVDPSFDVRAQDLENCQSVLPESVYGWLVDRRQRELARLVIHARAAEFGGSLAFTARSPRVTCRTISNSKITENTLEETILLEFGIRDAGIRQVVFELPASMAKARITAPQLRQTTVTPVENPAAGEEPLVRVQLDLQDDIMGQLHVKIVHDHLLTEAVHQAPIPRISTGEVSRQYVLLENAGRDELVVEQYDGLEQLTRQQQQWRDLTQLLGGGLTRAYIVRKGDNTPKLTFKTRQRKAVETARASIGLAKTRLVVDGGGAYRGVQEFRLDNETEQFLEVKLPEGASLWSAIVAGEPVKPIVATAAAGTKLQVPLIKTAKGDRDYAVVLKYGGSLGSIGSLSEVGFPLIHTVNINVEESQVRLFLPENHRWFDFGGDMKQVGEADLAAGEMEYVAGQLGKFAEVLKGKDEYAIARARANSSRLVAENKMLQHRQGEIVSNENLEKSIGLNTQAVDQLELQLKQQAQKADESAVTDLDNRRRLDQVWRSQRNDRGRNVVKEVGDNWNIEQEIRAANKLRQDISGKKAPAAADGFNPAWISGNGLQREDVAYQGRDADKQDGPILEQSKRKASRQGRYQVAPLPKPAAQLPQAGGFGNAPASRPPSSILNDDIGYLDEGEQAQTGEQVDSLKRNARRYRKKLEQQQVQAFGRERRRQAGVVVTPEAVDVADFPADGRGEANRQSIVGGKASGKDGQALGFVGGEATTSIAGMSSLDVEFPERGSVYLFSKALGSPQITARAISTPLLHRLESLAWIVGVVLLSLVLIRWIRRGGLALFADRRGSRILIVLGIASLVTCVFPVLGALMIFAGVLLFFRAPRAVAA